MTSLTEYLTNPAVRASASIDGGHAPWAAAWPCLVWLGMISEHPPDVTGTLTPQEIDALSVAMMARFIDTQGQLCWSSAMLESALAALSASTHEAPPEGLLRAAWNLLLSRPLDRLIFEFCSALGHIVLGGWRKVPGWNLTWMLGSCSDAQACLRYFTMGLSPDLWTDALEHETTTILRKSVGWP